MIAIAKRNIRIFFRDKASVFFSLLAVFIIIGLYVLFLGNTITQGMEDIPRARFLMDSWIMAGILSVTPVTTTMGAFGIIIEDKERKRLKDFLASPLKRNNLVAGYVVSSIVIGIIMSLITFVLAEIYIVSCGGDFLPFADIVKVLALILLTVTSGSALVFFIISFFNSSKAFATASMIIGTLIGFLTGIYIPIGILPAGVQAIIKIFPVSHAGVLLRQVMMEKTINMSFANAPQAVIDSFKSEMGINFWVGDKMLTPGTSILILVGTMIFFYLLAIINVSRKSK